MSHQVERLVFTGKKPWWYGNSSQKDAVGIDLGENAITSEQAIKAAGLDWLVVKKDAGFRDVSDEELLNGLIDEAGVSVPPIWSAVKGDCYLVRSRDNAPLGRCTQDYQEYQNAQAFKFLDSLVKEGELLYHTAGSLDGGKLVFILAQTPVSWEIKRKSGAVNKHHAFLNCILGHSGKAGIRLQPTDVRVECANTQSWADSKADGENLSFSIPHRGDIEAKLQLAGLAIQTLADQAPERRAVLQALANEALKVDDFIEFATSIFLGLDGEDEEIKEVVSKFYEDKSVRSKTILENKVAKVTELFLDGQGNEGNSSYDALQAFGEYFDHFDLDHIKDKIEQGKRAAKAVQSSWVGAGAERKSLVYKRLNAQLVH